MIKKKIAAAPAVKKTAKSESKAVAKPASKAAAKPSRKVPAGPATAATVAKRAVKPAVKPATKSPVEPSAKASSKPTATPAAVSVKPAAAKSPAANAATAARTDGVSAGSLLDTKDRPRKPKLVRDSFTMPEAEYAALGEVKKACLKAGYEVKKSELLRVGVGLIRTMDIVLLKDILAALPPLKAGRPKKS